MIIQDTRLCEFAYFEEGVFMARLTRFEVTRLISARALQISLGAPPLVKIHKNETPFDIAKAEFEKKVIPLAVVREYPDGRVEKVEVN